MSLPTGAATSANQTNASQKTQIVDGSGNVIASTSNNLNVQCANCSGSGVSTADGATWTAGTSLFAGMGGAYQSSATSNPLTAGKQGFAQLTQYRALMSAWFNSSGVEMGTSGSPVQVSLANTGANGTALAVSAAALPLPSGAATSALQPTNAAQGSTTSGQTGHLVEGAVTTAAPTYTTGQTNPLSLDTSGNLRVNVGTPSVAQSGTWNVTNISGTVSLPTGAATSANQSTEITNLGTIATNQTNITGSKAAGTAAANSQLDGAVYNTTLPTLTNGQQAAMQADFLRAADRQLRDRLFVLDFDHDMGGGTLGSMANYGTSPGSVLVPGVNAFVTNTNANGQNTMANSGPVALASNQSVADPCMFQAKTNLPISGNATALTQIIAASASTKIYICSISLVAAGATAFNLNTGTGTNCGTSTAAVLGSTTAANGLSFAASGGMTLGNGG